MLSWEDGEVPLRLESTWKTKIRPSLPKWLLPTKSDLPDGYREAVRDSEEARDVVGRFIEQALQEAPALLNESVVALGQ